MDSKHSKIHKKNMKKLNKEFLNSQEKISTSQDRISINSCLESIDRNNLKKSLIICNMVIKKF